MISGGEQANRQISFADHLLQFYLLIHSPGDGLTLGMVADELLRFADCSAGYPHFIVMFQQILN